MFVDTAAVMEKPLAATAGLGWQGKHTNLVSRQFGSWLFLGAIFTTLELPAGRSRGGPLRHLPRLPRHLPDRGVSRALSARCAALHFLSDHRAQGADPARIPRRDGQPHLRLRRLPRRVPVEQVRGQRPRGQARRARGACARRRSPNWRGSTTRNSARCSPRPRSSAPAATASCATCSSRSATPATRRWRAKPNVARDASPLVRGAAVWALSRLLPREKLAMLEKSDPDTSVNDEWISALSAV